MILIQGGFDTSKLVVAAEAYEKRNYVMLTGQTPTSFGKNEKQILKNLLQPQASNYPAYNVGNVINQEYIQRLLSTLPIQKVAKSILIQEITQQTNRALSIGSYEESASIEAMKKVASRICQTRGWTYSIYSTKYLGKYFSRKHQTFMPITNNNYDFAIVFFDAFGREVNLDDLRFEAKANLTKFHIAGLTTDAGPSGNKILDTLRNSINQNRIWFQYSHESGALVVQIYIEYDKIRRWVDDLLKSKFEGYNPIFISASHHQIKLASEVLQDLNIGKKGYAKFESDIQKNKRVASNKKITRNDISPSNPIEVRMNGNTGNFKAALYNAGIHELVYNKINQSKHYFDLWYGLPKN